jgi:hypothetical protein
MRFELSTLDNATGLDVTVAADLPDATIQAVRRLIRDILRLQIMSDRAALRLMWGFAELADKEGCAVLIARPTYSGCTITVAFAERMVRSTCNGCEDHNSFDTF